MLLAWSITAGRGGAGAGSDGKTGGTIVAENQNSNRKNENVRRANRIIQTRSFVLMILMGVVMFVLLFFRLFDLQITRHEELQGKAVNQQTRRTVVTANRGTIYDAGGNILAISSSAETIILSPLEIDNAVNDTEDPVSWTKESLAAGLAEILGKDASAIRKRMDNVKSQYEVIQLRADEDTAAKVRSYVDENKIAGVHLVADTKRYYPYGSLAAQVIGYIGKKKKALEDEDGNVVLDENGKEVMEYEKNKKGLWRLISIIPALIAIIVFIFTEDMTLPMIFVDKWTILHVVIALVQVVVMVLCKKKKDENDEDENAANA